MLLCWAYAGPPFFCTTFFEATGFLGNCMKLSDLQESEWHSWLYAQCKQCLRLFATVSHDISFLSCWPIWRVYRRCSHWFELGPTTHSLGWCPAWPPTAAATKYVSMFFFFAASFQTPPPWYLLNSLWLPHQVYGKLSWRPLRFYVGIVFFVASILVPFSGFHFGSTMRWPSKHQIWSVQRWVSKLQGLIWCSSGLAGGSFHDMEG